MSACMICMVMCACRNSTLTCSLACAIGLLHDETNTKLSIEQPMDLKPQKKMYLTLERILFRSHINPQAFSVPGSFLSQSIEEGVRVEELRQIQGVR